jgi:hypothetical protein
VLLDLESLPMRIGRIECQQELISQDKTLWRRTHIRADDTRTNLPTSLTLNRQRIRHVGDSQQSTELGGDNLSPVLASASVVRLEQHALPIVPKPKLGLAAQWFDILCAATIDQSYWECVH